MVLNRAADNDGAIDRNDVNKILDQNVNRKRNGTDTHDPLDSVNKSSRKDEDEDDDDDDDDDDDASTKGAAMPFILIKSLRF